jgi:hypothetical protein
MEGMDTASVGLTVPVQIPREAEPSGQALPYLVSWLESWASLTRLCTSMSVLSLGPERSFSAPICSRTAERCLAVHFRTKGFRWLKGNTITAKGLVTGAGVGPQTGTCVSKTVDL